MGISADAAPPAVCTLLETANTEVIFHLEVYVDSSIMSGTDVVKDLCFCAKAVGVERVALHGIGAGGVKGVERTFELHIMSRLAYIRIIISRD